MNGAGQVLVVPGLNGSGPAHWQSWIEPLVAARRVEQTDWTAPDIDTWSARVEQWIDACPSPVWLVAHSFGCLASVAAAGRVPAGRIAGALLVAPASPEKFGVTARIPATALPFPSILAASRNDPWMTYPSALSWAERWGSRIVDLGEAGHVNAEAGFGPWPDGLALLRQLQQGSAGPAGPAKT
jgi:predicted alpha/beta hydrolase family esterase